MTIQGEQDKSSSIIPDPNTSRFDVKGDGESKEFRYEMDGCTVGKVSKNLFTE